MLKGGVIGAGMVADQKHLPRYAQLDDAAIVAICDPNTERARALADKYGITHVFSSEDELLKMDGLDFVCVCSPNAFHRDTVLKAISLNIPVHCEKPLTVSGADAAAIDAAAVENHVLVMPAMNNRFSNAATFLKRAIDTGKLGKIYHFRCVWTRRRGIPGRGSWFTRKAMAGGGPLIDLGVHLLDLAMYLTGAWDYETVSAQTTANFFDDPCLNTKVHGTAEAGGATDVEDRAEGFIRFQNGCTCSFSFGWASNIPEDERLVEILGTKAGARIINQDLLLFGEAEGSLIDIRPDLRSLADPASEHQHFIDCVRTADIPIATTGQAVCVMRIIDAAYRSAATRKEVSWLDS